MSRVDARAATLALLAARAEGATVCPSEVARAVTEAAGDWREAMPEFMRRWMNWYARGGCG